MRRRGRSRLILRMCESDDFFTKKKEEGIMLHKMYNVPKKRMYIAIEMYRRYNTISL